MLGSTGWVQKAWFYKLKCPLAGSGAPGILVLLEFFYEFFLIFWREIAWGLGSISTHFNLMLINCSSSVRLLHTLASFWTTPQIRDNSRKIRSDVDLHPCAVLLHLPQHHQDISHIQGEKHSPDIKSDKWQTFDPSLYFSQPSSTSLSTRKDSSLFSRA